MNKLNQSMNMKSASSKFLAAILFSGIPIASLRAQTNAADETVKNQVLDGIFNKATIVPLAGMFIAFAIPVTIIGIAAYAKYRRHKMANETLRAMIEKGLPITPELVDSLKSKHSKSEIQSTGSRSQRDLRNGLILTGIGIGLVMLCGKVGWIVVFLGVAFLLIGMLNIGKGNNNDQTPK